MGKTEPVKSKRGRVDRRWVDGDDDQVIDNDDENAGDVGMRMTRMDGSEDIKTLK